MNGPGPAALAVALAGGVATVALSLRRRPVAAERALVVTFAGLSVALVTLAVALVRVDASLTYVADHTSRATSWPYRLSGLWGGMAGSLALWTWMAAGWAVVARRSLRTVGVAAYAVVGAYLAVFCGLLVTVSRPFDRLDIPALDGGGLNPVLLHPAMLYHPPMLYAGAVGLLVPFALAVAGLVRRDAGWLAPAARWAGASVVLLGAGMVAGAHWAYVELGWGGYWAWDPVENGGLLPWLAAVAFLHAAVAARRQRGPSPVAAGLAALAFLLGLLGSFLTRSGASVSVHAFAEARAVGWALGLALAASTAVTIVLLWRRRAPASTPAGLTVMGANHLLLVGLAAVIGFGTLFPVVVHWLTGDRVVVTGRYFALVAAPIAVAVVALLGAGPLLGRPGAARELRPALAGLVVAALAGAWFAERRPLAVLLVGLAGAAAALTVTEWRRRPRLRWPLAHLGIAVLLAGVAGTTTGAHVTAALAPGDVVTVRGWTLELLDVVPASAPDGGRAARANLALSRHGDRVTTLRPVALVSPTGQRVAVAALRSTPLGDVQVALRSVGDGGATAVVEVGVIPLLQLVWWGGLLAVAGLALSAARPAEPAAAGDVQQNRASPVRPSA